MENIENCFIGSKESAEYDKEIDKELQKYELDNSFIENKVLSDFNMINLISIFPS